MRSLQKPEPIPLPSDFLTLSKVSTPVFHVSMLEPAIPNEILNRVKSPPLPVNIEGELEYEISKIIDSKIDKHQSCKLLYLVCWLGYKNTNQELSWLPATELEHAEELISNFYSAYLQKPSPISKL